MHLHDLIDPRDLETGMAGRLITRREHEDGQVIYNYSDSALYTPGAWDNPAVRQCRGLITSPGGWVVARPWAKFFNHGQPEAGDLPLDAPVEVTDKIDGSLGILHYGRDGDPRVATRGSFYSEQAVHATGRLRQMYPWWTWPEEFTPLVEIVYPENRIVCDYGDRDELVLLGAVHIEDGTYHGPDEAADLILWPGDAPRARTFPCPTVRDALAMPPRPGAEGLCLRLIGENRIVKVKQDDYVRLHRIVTGLSERSVWAHMTEKRPLEELLEPLPDELHQWTRDVWNRIAGQVSAHADEVERIYADMSHLADDRAAFAAEANRRGEYRPWLFMRLDGRDFHPSILKTLRPEGVRPRAYSEATA